MKRIFVVVVILVFISGCSSNKVTFNKMRIEEKEPQFILEE